MKKQIYYKLCEQHRKLNLVSGYGYSKDLVLPNGEFMMVFIEYMNGEWTITDNSSGLKMNMYNRPLKNKKDLDTYLHDNNILFSFQRARETAFYKKQCKEFIKLLEKAAGEN